MTKEVTCCQPDTDLAAASGLMWENDCGVLPVVEHGDLTGIITDRDICIALGTNNRRAADVPVREVASRDVQICSPDADVKSAMATMRRAKVRRLPVVEDGKLEGILALNDIVEAVDRKHGDIDYEEVMNTVKAISEHWPHKPATSAAAASQLPAALGAA